MSIITAYELAKNKKILLGDLNLQEKFNQYGYKDNYEDKIRMHCKTHDRL
ncbi:hypothetical protein [Paraclostridium sordellii]|nr:hypothetical protein [Paeniclostridium sordellii]